MFIAKADIQSDSIGNYLGTITFTQMERDGPVRIHGELKNLIPNTRYHGFHVHQLRLPEGERNCSLTGPHFNPFGIVYRY